MKVVIFAGGLGTRISEESHLRPKPMIEIGGRPLLWHIMKIYESQGFNEFVICLGYKGYVIKEYFINYFLHNSDITVDLETNELAIHRSASNTFKVTLVDTGLETQTAGRLQRVRSHLTPGEDFMLTYGDGVGDVDLKRLLEHHREHGVVCTMTVVQPAGRFGGVEFGSDGRVTSFQEKPLGDGNWINGGFFVLKERVFDFLDAGADRVMWEDAPLQRLAAAGELAAYPHRGFWRCMDALRDKVILEDLWARDPKWKTWS